MRQVCIEASNESFAGNFGFYEEKKDEEEDKKERLAETGKKKERRIATAVKCLRGSFSILPHCEDKRLESIKLAGSLNPTTGTAAAGVYEP